VLMTDDATVERYGPGEAATVVRPGDFILTHRRRRLMPGLITLAQRRRFTGDARPFAHWSHAALITTAEGTLVEAEGRGVQRSTIAKYHQDEYHLVRMDAYLDDQQRTAAAQLAERQVGEGFGYLVMLSLAIWLLTGVPLRWARRDHQICSGLVARALRAAGQRFARPPAFMLPADLAEAYGARVSHEGAPQPL
jgi:uncharacterized protein YycO